MFMEKKEASDAVRIQWNNKRIKEILTQTHQKKKMLFQEIKHNFLCSSCTCTHGCVCSYMDATLPRSL